MILDEHTYDMVSSRAKHEYHVAIEGMPFQAAGGRIKNQQLVVQ
jgi:hypothetical protein